MVKIKRLRNIQEFELSGFELFGLNCIITLQDFKKYTRLFLDKYYDKNEFNPRNCNKR